jgi:hypothetical protein
MVLEGSTYSTVCAQPSAAFSNTSKGRKKKERYIQKERIERKMGIWSYERTVFQFLYLVQGNPVIHRSVLNFFFLCYHICAYVVDCTDVNGTAPVPWS